MDRFARRHRMVWTLTTLATAKAFGVAGFFSPVRSAVRTHDQGSSRQPVFPTRSWMTDSAHCFMRSSYPSAGNVPSTERSSIVYAG